MGAKLSSLLNPEISLGSNPLNPWSSKTVGVIAPMLSKFLKHIRGSGKNKERLLQIKVEDICCRFPHLAEEIMKQIDYQSLTNCKLANRDISKFLDKGRFLWKQMILKNITGNHLSVFNLAEKVIIILVFISFFRERTS